MISKDLVKNITDLRESPLKVFRTSKKKGRPLFVFNRAEPVGVVLDWEQYERLQERLEDLSDLRELKEAKATSTELVEWKKLRQELLD